MSNDTYNTNATIGASVDVIINNTITNTSNINHTEPDVYIQLGILCGIIVGTFILSLLIDRCINRCFDKSYYVFTTAVAVVTPYGILTPYVMYVFDDEKIKTGVIITICAWSGILLLGTVILCIRKRRSVKSCFHCMCCSRNSDSGSDSDDEEYVGYSPRYDTRTVIIRNDDRADSIRNTVTKIAYFYIILNIIYLIFLA
ncbi:hypothetical protein YASMINEVIRUS_671 [Yasminevirus sp. GU-2018]|uniref:Uncharacterized protein n=1 Tax=Yasminevirus sp. GU-2018 TaxID=2420051 RepID=A0A5K0U854_9VIRU|nr:hypothetical protein YASMINEVIRUS_671 [Yasminevirus sp. GU-2018]